jgi:hypothetical protein
MRSIDLLGSPWMRPVLDVVIPGMAFVEACPSRKVQFRRSIGEEKLG